MISPLFKVRDYALKDVNSYDIKIAWKSDANESTKSVTHLHPEPRGCIVHSLPSNSPTLAPHGAHSRMFSQRDARVQGV